MPTNCFQRFSVTLYTLEFYTVLDSYLSLPLQIVLPIFPLTPGWIYCSCTIEILLDFRMTQLWLGLLITLYVSHGKVSFFIRNFCRYNALKQKKWLSNGKISCRLRGLDNCRKEMFVFLLVRATHQGLYCILVRPGQLSMHLWGYGLWDKEDFL